MPVKAALFLKCKGQLRNLTIAQHLADTMLQKQAELPGAKKPNNVDIQPASQSIHPPAMG
jgi:hypothetical protein